jgi:Synergist-CTERM protein sorting domain-containing protein
MTGGRGWERYKITGKGPGAAVIKVTYDALTNSAWQVWNVVPNENGSGSHHEYPNNRKNTDIGQQLFYPSEPGCTAVVVVNVTENGAADNTGVSTNIREREFDTIYFAGPQDSAAYTFAPTAANGEVSVRVHKPLHNTEWGAGWTEYGTKPSGTSFDVTLYEGHNIVEVSGGGAKKYHSIYAKPAKITITNLTNPEGGSDYFTPGDEVNISIKGLKVPVQKLAGIYNPGIAYDPATGQYWETGCFLYDDAAGNTLESTKRQYDMKLGMDLNYVIQEDTTLRNGRIDCAHIGAPLGTHRFFDTTIAPNLDEDAETIPGIYSTLPDIVLTVRAPDDPDDPDDTEPDVPTVSVGNGEVVDSGHIGDAIDKAGSEEQPTIVISVAADSGVREVTAKISASDLGIVAESDVENIKIASAIGEVTLNTAAVNDLLDEAGPEAVTVDVVISRKDEADKEELLESEDLTEAQKAALADGHMRDVYDVSIYAGYAGDNDKKLLEGGSASKDSKLTIGLPYELRTGEKARGVGVAYIGEKGAEPMPAYYNSGTKLAVFTTNHLSLYGVTYTPVSEGGSGGCDAGFGALALLALALLSGIRVRKE